MTTRLASRPLLGSRFGPSDATFPFDSDWVKLDARTLLKFSINGRDHYVSFLCRLQLRESELLS